MLQFPVSRPQLRFITTRKPYPLFLAGYGAGKTIAGIVRTLILKCRYPKQDQGYYLPTFPLVRSVGYPAFFEVMDAMEIHGTLLKSEKLIEVQGAGAVHLRSMENPEYIVGYKHADATADELDTLPKEKARTVFRKILGRNRQKKPDGSPNTFGVVTTPEGYRFCYDQWQRDPLPGSEIIRASTFSNARNLPGGYIQSLFDAYPTSLLQAYIEGMFCNLTSGSVYPQFDRKLNDTNVAIEPNEPLHIGMDFNVGKMAAIVHIVREGKPHAVGELVKMLDTPAMIKAIDAKYDKHPISVYPDASGQNRKAQNASESDLALLRGARYSVCANLSNPRVKDRIIAMNSMINRDGARDYRVSQDRCPTYVECLEQQAYDENGEPDKKSGHDHANDAGGYFISYRYPIIKPATVINLGRAH